MRDLVGHDRKPTSFLVYLWLDAEQTRRDGPVQASYVELAESVGVRRAQRRSRNWLLREALTVKGQCHGDPSYRCRGRGEIANVRRGVADISSRCLQGASSNQPLPRLKGRSCGRPCGHTLSRVSPDGSCISDCVRAVRVLRPRHTSPPEPEAGFHQVASTCSTPGGTSA
jgi:hypothetical protein